MKYGLIIGFVATVFAANWALGEYGIVPIGFGLSAPAGVYFVGIAFTLRDGIRERAGQRWVVVAILLGAGLAFLLEDSRKFAVASAVAFLFSESADALVYEPLRDRTWLGAVTLSNTVGLVLDSVLFLWLAFGSLAFIEGQIVGKLYMTAIAVVLIGSWRAVSQRVHTA